MNTYKNIESCRCCGSYDLFKYLDLGNQPLANSYHKGQEELPLFPLDVYLCENCFHSQLGIVVKPELMFKHYLYVSGTTDTFRKHCDELAKDSIEHWLAYKPNKNNPRVLDIACNDGTLLGYFRDRGAEVFGVDPAENLNLLTKEKNIPVKVGYWGSGQDIYNGMLFDIITATNVFAHVDNTAQFLKEAKNALFDDGILVLEFPYCNSMINNVEFDTVYHEHLSYFLVNSIAKLIDRNGFVPTKILKTPIHGGSIRFYLRKADVFENTLDINLWINEERNAGLLDKQSYIDFSNNVEYNKKHLNALVSVLREGGKKVIGYGASAKGNTMLNHFELDLDYIVDDNSMKWGYLTPGRNIPIKSPDVMAEENELYIIILSWNFYKEIKSKIEKICDNKQTYILYVPSVIVE